MKEHLFSHTLWFLASKSLSLRSASSNSLTTMWFPDWHAQWRGVLPWVLSLHCMLAPNVSNNLAGSGLWTNCKLWDLIDINFQHKIKTTQNSNLRKMYSKFANALLAEVNVRKIKPNLLSAIYRKWWKKWWMLFNKHFYNLPLKALSCII